MLMKSRAALLKATYEGILIDATHAFPEKTREFARDLARLQTIIDRNELWFFTTFLPTFSKHLTRCLDEGIFLPFPGPHMRPKKGCVYPRLFSGLTEMIFYDNGVLREDTDSNPLLFLQTLCVCMKKLRMNCDDSTVRRTVESFVQVEEGVRHHTLNWGDGLLRHDRGLSIVGDDCCTRGSETAGLFDKLHACHPALLPHFGAIQSVADRIFSRFGSPFDRELEPRHGPGAISDRSNNASKYQFHNWPEKLEQCFPAAVFGLPNASYWLQPVLGSDRRLRFRRAAVTSRLLAVPKTQKGPRLIAAEPVANMWMQQALLYFIADGIASSPLSNCIDLRDQTKSGSLALKASLTKSHATIDLSDASDRLSCWLVERLFRSNFDLLQAFNAVRTDVLSIDSKESKGKEFPKLIKLKKFSTQGSALTFPVQTIVYACIVIGVLIEESKKRVNAKTIAWASKEVRLFGDDIIVPNSITGKVVECLEALGFKVNTSKTFSKGDFRESCGVDGWKGDNVTPPYVLEPYDRAKPGSVASLVECCNNFYMKGFWHTAELLKSTIPSDIVKRLPVVHINKGVFTLKDLERGSEGSLSRAFGFVSFGRSSIGSNRSRFNHRLHREEIQVLQPTATVERTRIRGDYALHQYFTERPAPDTIWAAGEARRPKLTMKLRWVPAERLGMGPK